MVGKIGIGIAILLLVVFLAKGGDKITKNALDKARDLKDKALSKVDTLNTNTESKKKFGGQNG